MMCSCACADVSINADNFPDQAFRNAVILYEVSQGNGDKVFTDSELASLQSVIVNSYGIRSLKGIEYLTGITRLECRSNELTELDVSSNAKLVYLDCSNNQITDLKLNSSLQELDCKKNKLAELDLRGCQELMRLQCSENSSLMRLDVSECRKLETLYCVSSTFLPELSVNGLTSLVTLDCSYCPFMTSLDVSGCTSLESLSCYNTMARNGMISELDVSSCTKLRRLLCAANTLTKLALGDKTELVYLDCRHNSISELDVKRSANLKTLYCQNNQIAELDLSECKELTDLDCSWNWLTELDVSSNRKLVSLYCTDNSLTELNLNSNTSLRFVDFGNNQFAAIDLNGLLTMNPQVGDIGGQRIGHLVVEHQSDGNTSYPYYVDFTRYMTSSQASNIIASSVRGFDEDNAEIATAYSNGTAHFSSAPSIVRYSYSTGYSNVSFDAAVIENDYLSMSLNNHVYRIFPRGMRWTNAKEYCESLGGHLVTISSREERDLVMRLCIRANEILAYAWPTFWTGGEKVGYGSTVNRWRWITGESFTETVSEDISRLAEDGVRDIATETRYSERYYRNLGMNTGGALIPRYSIAPYGFICEWEPEAADFAPYSEEYRRYLADPASYFTEDSFRGSLPEPVDYSHLASNPPVFSNAEFSASALEAVYDPRNRGTISPVRNQTHAYRTCWTFAALGTLETSYLHQGYGTSVPDLSELHMAWYTYMDPRTEYRETLFSADRTILNQGGNNTYAVAFMSRAGVAAENDMPYSTTAEIGSLYSGDTFPDRRFPEEYSHPLRLKEAYVFGDITADNRETVKNLIKRYGAVSINYDAEHHGDSLKAYYYDSIKSYGHAVSVVGWDDNYSRENFTGYDMPQTDGAWLAKNSYGEEAGDGGYFWLSYEQKIGGAAVYVAADSRVNKLYGHDTIAAKDTIPHNWAAVILRAEDDEAFSEVSFHTRNNNVRYALYINKLGSDEEPSKPGIPGTAAASGTIELAGYHTVTLNTPLEVKEGEYFSVMLKLEDDSEYGYISAVEDTGVFRSSRTITVAGKSYFADISSDAMPKLSDWKDGKQLYEEGTVRDASCGACIKIFASGGGTNPTRPNDDDPSNNDNPNNNNNDPNNNNNGNEDSSGNSGGGGSGGCSTGISVLAITASVLALLMKKSRNMLS